MGGTKDRFSCTLFLALTVTSSKTTLSTLKYTLVVTMIC
jgi:hypothetical protein